MRQARDKLPQIENPGQLSPAQNHLDKQGTKKGTATITSLFKKHHFQNGALCLLIFLVASGFNLYHLGTPSIWFDEAFSVELARQPLPLLWHVIWGPEPNMELYYLFLHFWLGFTALLGLHATEFVVRFPSAIFAALSAVVVYLLGRRYLGIIAGIVGAILYLLNDLQLVYAQQTRSYSLQLLLLCVSWYAFFAAISYKSNSARQSLQRNGEANLLRSLWSAVENRWWLCFIIATALAVYAHLFSLVILFSQLLAFAGLLLLPGPWRNQIRRQVPAFLISLVILCILILPMLLASRNGPNTGWLPVPHLNDIVHLFLTISGDSKAYLLAITACCVLGLLIALLVYLPGGKHLLDQIASKDSRNETNNTEKPAYETPLAQYLSVGFASLCWLLVPVIITYVVSKGATRLFSTRYLVTIVPPLCLLTGLGIVALRWRVLQVALALVLVLLALYSVPLYYRSAQVEDWNTAVPWLEHYYQPGDGLVCYDSEVRQGCQISVEYYLHISPTGAHFTSDSPGAFSWANFGPVNPTAGAEAAVDPNALAVYGAKHTRIFYIVGRIPDDNSASRAKAAQSWLDNHYRFIAQVVTPTVTIRLYATAKTSLHF